MFNIVPYRHRNASIFNYMDELERSFFSPSISGASQFRCDIRDEGDHYVMAAELPGFSKDEIEIEHNSDALSITATHKSENEEKDDDGNFLRRERRFGRFSRSFDLSGIDTAGIKANYKNGVLNLTLPKAREQAPASHKIAIEE